MSEAMHHYSGSCSCGSVTVTLTLPAPLRTYTPRQCDCDYCMANDGIYVSDPKGRLRIDTSAALTREKQGSGQADMVKCPECGDLIAVTCCLEEEMKGAVRMAILNDWHELPAPQVVSPKSLAAEAKRERWKTAWLRLQFT